MSIKVSVIVPVYNVEKYIERCLNSLVNQTLQDIEIIVVNDGTKDGSQAIIDEFVKKYPQKVFSHVKENGGLSDARNYGIPFARGEYTAFVDSDDYVDPRMYEKLYNKAIEDNSEMVVCGYFKVDLKNNTMMSAQIGNEDEYGVSVRENKNILFINAPYAWNKLVKTDLISRSKILFPKGYIYEDISTMYPLAAMANRVSKVNEELYYYIVEREDSITATFNKSRCLIIKSLELLCQRFEERGMLEEYRDEILTIVLRHIYFRFNEFDRYKDRKMQLELIKESFALIKKYFPDWKKNPGHYPYLGVEQERSNKIWFYKRKKYWQFISLLPLDFIVWLRQVEEKHKRFGRELRYDYVDYCNKKHVVKHRVLIESFHGKSISDSPYYIMKELLKRKKYDIYVASTQDDLKENKAFVKQNNLNVTVVSMKTKKYYEILATAKYLVNNVSFPPCFTKREGQIYLNTWHGTPLKTLGKNMKKGIESMHNIQHNFLQTSHMLFPNKYTKEKMMEDYNLNSLYTGETVIGGYPRNSILNDKEAGLKIKRQLGLEGKTVYVYMPTWRGKNSYGLMKTNNIHTILEQIDLTLDDNSVMFVNLHPNVKEEINYDMYKHINVFPAGIANYDFINSSDVLITDYSSIFFDYSITRKPIILFMYDYDEYMEDRGTYINAKELPFHKVYTIEDLCKSLKNKDYVNQNYGENKEYVDMYLSHENINATKNIVDYIFSGKNNGLDVEDYSRNKDIPRKVCVQLSTIETKEEYDKFIQENNEENTIFVIRNIYFNSLMNKWFYEEYNDKINYVIFGYCKMISRDQVEIWNTTDKEHKKERKKIKKQARERAFQRTLPNLKIINKNEIKRVI